MGNPNTDSDPATALPRELQQAWLQLVRGHWSSMAVIPTEPGTSARRVSGAIIKMAPFYDLGEFRLIDAEGASLQDGVRLAHELDSYVSKGARVVVAVDSPMHNGGAMPLVMAADSALLLIRLGSSKLDSVRNLVDIVGRERVVGAVALRRARRRVETAA